MLLQICFKCFNFGYLESNKSKIHTCVKCNKSLTFLDHPDKLNILHADMDAFFANIEILDNPDLQNKPVIIGGDIKSRSVVSTCSYKARQYGIHSAMPIAKAYKLCPHGIFLPPRLNRYQEISKKIFKIFATYTPSFEPLSIDEAFLDMTGTEKIHKHPVIAALRIKEEIKSTLGLTVSIGIAENKFLAKLASDEKKPDGIFIVTKNQTNKYLDNLKINKMWGIGKKTLPIMKRHKIFTIGDIKKSSQSKLQKIFGNRWLNYLNLAQGIDNRKVFYDEKIKSIGSEQTLPCDIFLKEDLLSCLWNECSKVSRRLYNYGLKGQTISLKIKTSHFNLLSRSKTLSFPLYADIDIFQISKKLLYSIDLNNIKVRLIGISVSQLVKEENQLELNFTRNCKIKNDNIQKAINQIKDKYGEFSINRAIGLTKKHH